MPLVLGVLEAKEAAVGVSVPRSVVAAAVAFTHHLAVEGGFIHHLAASIRAEEWAGSIRLFTASTDLLVMVSRTLSVMHRIFMAFPRTRCTRMG